MRRFFLFIMLLIALVSFFRSNLFDDLMYGTDFKFSNWFNHISEAAEERVMEEFREKVKPIFDGLRPQQVEYAALLMKDRQTLGVFYLRYCKTDDINPFVYGETLERFCEQIRQADILNNT